MAPHSSTLAWKSPWTEEPGRLQSMGLLRVGHDWVTSLSLFTFMHWRRKWHPTPVFLPGESQGRGILEGCHLWGQQSRTRLKRLCSSSSSSYTLDPSPWWFCSKYHLTVWNLSFHFHMFFKHFLFFNFSFWKTLRLIKNVAETAQRIPIHHSCRSPKC